jgi:hypothetical protein
LLAGYDPARAATDAAAALARRERYLLGVYGVATEVPGQRDGTVTVRMINGTSDSDCPNLNHRAREYARRFNAAMQAAPQ